MIDDAETFEEVERRAERTRQAQDRHDFNNEQAGRDTGRMARFLPGDAAKQKQAAAKKRQQERFLNELQRLLDDPVYAARYRSFGSLLDEADAWAAERKSALQSALGEAETAIAVMLDQAAKLPDGRRVFRNSDGRVIDEYLNTVSDSEAAAVIWPEDAPSADVYVAARRRQAELQAALDDHETWEVDVLGRSRDRYEDTDEPITPAEMDAWEDRISTDMHAFDAYAPEAPTTVPTLDAGASGARTQKPTL